MLKCGILKYESDQFHTIQQHLGYWLTCRIPHHSQTNLVQYNNIATDFIDSLNQYKFI